MEIQIRCQGAALENLDDLVVIQGSLKELSEVNYAKLHDLIIQKGFDSPIQIWIDPEGKKQILDGTQRTRVLLKLRDEGYSIPLIPVDYIFADNKTDAKERLLSKVSVYGQVTEEGLYGFNNEEDSIIDASFSELLDIPGFNFDKDDVETKKDKKVKEHICPSCGEVFTE